MGSPGSTTVAPRPRSARRSSPRSIGSTARAYHLRSSVPSRQTPIRRSFERPPVEEPGVVGGGVDFPAAVAASWSRGSTPVACAEEHRGRVATRPADRADRVLVGRDRNDAGSADEPHRRLVPTTPCSCEGQTIEPSVSVPSAAAAEMADAATPDPELEPHGFDRGRSGLSFGRRRHSSRWSDWPTEVRPLGQVRLAEDDRAGGRELLRDEGVARACCRRAPRSRLSSACRWC